MIPTLSPAHYDWLTVVLWICVAAMIAIGLAILATAYDDLKAQDEDGGWSE